MSRQFIVLQNHQLEYQWFEPQQASAALPISPISPISTIVPNVPIVLLHEGLGCISLWKDFPQKLATLTQRRVLAYSRAGYGQSSAAVLPRPVNFMQLEAWVVLPSLLAKLNIARPILLGHSDGGSIALLHAARHACEKIIVLAPHVFVEEMCVTSIAQARAAYETVAAADAEAYSHSTPSLRQRLARHHADVDNAFYGWNDIWLHPDFRAWNIEAEVAKITTPILAIQGADDPYGSMMQIEKIAEACRHTRLLKLPDCKHSPQLEKPEAVLDAVTEFLR